MISPLEDFVNAHPTVTLSHTHYGLHFHLGDGVNILSTPPQRLQSFVEDDGSPYRFIVVGKLSSFKIVEDTVCMIVVWLYEAVLTCLVGEFGYCLSVNLGQFPSQSSSVFFDIFRRQLETLLKIEEDDGMDENVHLQVGFDSPSAIVLSISR